MSDPHSKFKNWTRTSALPASGSQDVAGNEKESRPNGLTCRGDLFLTHPVGGKNPSHLPPDLVTCERLVQRGLSGMTTLVRRAKFLFQHSGKACCCGGGSGSDPLASRRPLWLWLSTVSYKRQERIPEPSWHSGRPEQEGTKEAEFSKVTEQRGPCCQS